jgi:tRNA-specific 2-thiouridylase
MSTMEAIDLQLSDETLARVRQAMDLPGDPGQHRVVAAMSGGVDSSVVAGLLKACGYNVLGITLQLYDHGEAVRRKGACCAGQDIHDARRVAAKLGIAHYVLDFESRFKEAVMEDFAESYLRGETPIPCVRCNQTVKFSDLLARTADLGASALVTGHYVMSAARGDGHRALLTPADEARDQSYFLFATTQAQLDLLRFPLGGFAKPEVRQMAEAMGLEVAAKPDSQDICFVPEGRYADVIARLRPEAAQPGEIVDRAGRVLGTHEGIMHFTVGQRKGLGIVVGGGEPLYVLSIEPKARRVVVGPREALAQRDVPLGQVNWLGREGLAVGSSREIFVKIRSAKARIPGELMWGAQGARVRLAVPEMAISPGQACVFYAGEGPGAEVLGGGFITRG